MEQIKSCKSLDLCFMVDATGSMGSYIAGVIKCVQSIDRLAEPLKTHFKLVEGELRVSLVAYRDYSDGNDRFQILDFTPDCKEFVRFCSDVKANGGGDSAEDVFGGINKVVNLNWASETGTRVMFHVADAACHGSRFAPYDGYSDDHRDADPDGRTIDVLMKQLRATRIQYHFGRIQDETDNMMVEFSKEYGGQIPSYPVHDPDSIERAVLDALCVACDKSIYLAKRGVNNLDISEYRVSSDSPDWNDICSINLEFKKTKSIVKISPDPFKIGTEYLVYRCQIDGVDSVLKKFRFKLPMADLVTRVETEDTASSLLTELCPKFGTLVNALGYKVDTVEHKIMRNQDQVWIQELVSELPDTKVLFRFAMNVSFRQMEIRAGLLGIRTKYINLVHAFSHWSYVQSNGKYMIADVKAVVPSYDQSEHSNDVTVIGGTIYTSIENSKSPLDLGKYGIDMFFSMHSCNDICKMLNL